ncbi:Mg2+-importing ATPase [Phyllobacterium trifolii]|uniref:Magnesium-transporting ATPase, P-type 1 n=1 Tax=Phyllobacterium trifolii TaxID=300193 RepID=A0A839UEH4_9HYPH|nr:magnesium-translocating P-type ATPase [Phyllobacterium trifolii]MBB3146839.1 Mg2+-importing ATPase [Phyllobacterium trifolii]
MSELTTTAEGLSSIEAKKRLAAVGRNSFSEASGTSAIATLARQFRSPLVLILVFAAGASAAVGEGHESIIITAIVLASCLLSFTQEYGASKAVQALREVVAHKATVMRDGEEISVSASEIVPGDVLHLSAGNLIPADGIILEARDFNVSESALTGETFPAVKSPGISDVAAGLAARSNSVFTGTSVRSGTATVLVVRTGRRTEFASIAAVIERRIPETEFARGIRRFGYLMTEIMLAIVILVLVANLLLHRPLIDSLLFSLALAVGLTPELLPAIISVTLARGARAMAKAGVVVRRLDAIENLGSMDLLCTDKTGTLTEGVIHLDGCLDAEGKASQQVAVWARLNATLQTGLKNPLDESIASAEDATDCLAHYVKVDEIPYDFIRKRLSVIVRESETSGNLVVCKGAVQNVLEVCTSILVSNSSQSIDARIRADIETRFKTWSGQGYRVLGLAIRRLSPDRACTRQDETDLCFAGFLLFLDPPKQGMAETLASLASRGIGIKVITGDNRYVAAHLAESIGLAKKRVITGQQLARMTKNALFAVASKTDLFVEIDPNQKERIVEALQSRGHVVGYLGDGINDAPALHAADVGISVNSAVDVAREAADIILLERDLGVLGRGVDDGRKTFANTMKYISITTSANFGNMVSMALASLFLPFLPLLAKQILLNNFLSDLPSLAISTDNVDEDQTRMPRHWDIAFIRRFMLTFGLVSSFFDFMTFGFLIFVAHATAQTFQTAWFIESLITELAIVLVVRTRKAFWQSRPSALLVWLTAGTFLVAVATPILPYAAWFGFVPLPLPIMAGLVAITIMYLIASEATKHLVLLWHTRFLHARRGKSTHQLSTRPETGYRTVCCA